ncbi:hypothetical protein [Pseudonocardia phyllosphaerae]|uniref:hypothetical protein n=1 Tax=Pseudonocardia phyllosphaerae TaxID=3390502 RepID=UPI00397D09C3
MTERRLRNTDPVALVAGLFALVGGGFGVAGTSPAELLDLRWVLAAAAVLAGLAILVAGLRNSRATSDDV